MKTLRTLLFFIVMGALSFFPAAASDIFIQNAQLITVSQGTIENGSLWVQDGKITALGANLSAPEGATVIDGYAFHWCVGWAVGYCWSAGC